MGSSPFPTGAVRPMAFQVDLLSHPEEEAAADLLAEAGHRSHRAGADHPGEEEEEEAAPGEAGAQVSVFRSVPVRMVSHPQLRPRQVAEAAAAASEAALEAVLEAAEDRPEEAELRPRPQ